MPLPPHAMKSIADYYMLQAHTKKRTGTHKEKDEIQFFKHSDHHNEETATAIFLT
jgi:hypothetical protein